MSRMELDKDDYVRDHWNHGYAEAVYIAWKKGFINEWAFWQLMMIRMIEWRITVDYVFDKFDDLDTISKDDEQKLRKAYKELYNERYLQDVFDHYKK